MRDVAQTAGVSLKTVSRVINEEAGVAAGTAARVSEAVAELGFERNDLARSLRHGHSSATLGLVIEDLANPFYSAVAQAVEVAARDRGFLLITASAREDAERERELVALLRRRVDALLMVPAGPDHRYVTGSTRTVFLDRPARGIAADTVLLDNRGGARRAVEHLIETATRGSPASPTPPGCTPRRSGWPATGMPCRRPGSPRTPRSCARATTMRSRRRRTSSTCSGSPTSAGRPPSSPPTTATPSVPCTRWRSAGGRVALVGFDDFELADLLGTTVVRADPGRLGDRAAEIAFARLDGDDAPLRTVTLATELVVRGSGELAP